MSLEDYDRMYAEQEGKCAICGEHKDKLVVDHNHTTGVVRGLLCNHCNVGIGMLGEDTGRMLKAVAYLSR